MKLDLFLLSNPINLLPKPNRSVSEATGSYIRGSNGRSNGLIPMLRNFNETARFVEQGGGKRAPESSITEAAFSIFFYCAVNI